MCCVLFYVVCTGEGVLCDACCFVSYVQVRMCCVLRFFVSYVQVRVCCVLRVVLCRMCR